MARGADGRGWFERLAPGLARRRAERDLEAALGEGVWRRAHDRVHRSVDRYHQVLDGVVADAAPGAAESVLPPLQRTAEELVRVLDDVRALCLRAQRAAPSAGLDVPRPPVSADLPDELHRRLSKVGTAVATAAEAATMARVSARAGQLEVGVERTAAAQRAAAAARRHLGWPPPG
ncbi:hypothetical protein [uncultured Pseudokineococcus sp.]|uniref:hypothetical protein n=1 Tax=uncultured Pseudokineococcus sp. TaxID=1642928 RepID=UPI002621E565|nr:hypothetical protein [uncultured Pseudokineococcus sp.]